MSNLNRNRVPLLTTSQFDASKYTPVGSVIVNYVESISLARGIVASVGATFGGKSSFIQTKVDSFQKNALNEFRNKIKTDYPNTRLVVSLRTDISDVGRGDGITFMVMTISGTCLEPMPATNNSGRNITRKNNTNPNPTPPVV